MTEKQVWEKIAPFWNRYRRVPMKNVVEFLEDKKGKVLDLGCGSGRNFVKNEGQELYATDFSGEMVRLATENAKKMGIEGEFKVMDATKIEYEDEFFDSVLCAAVIHCIDNEKKRIKAMEEIYRVLKPNGKALVVSWGKKSNRMKNKKKEDRIPWTLQDEEKILRYNYIYDLEELTSQLEKVGFKIEKSWEDKNVNVIVSKTS